MKLIRQTRQATPKRYTAEEKIHIVMEGIRGEEPVSAICRREGLHSNLYYRWLKELVADLSVQVLVLKKSLL